MGYEGKPLSSVVESRVAKPGKMLIGGAWRPAVSERTIEVIDPATGRAFTTVPAGDAQDIDLAVTAARRALESGPWPAMKPTERERLLWKLAELIERDANEFSELEALDNGKPITAAKAFDLAAARDFCRYMAGWATKIGGQTLDPSLPYGDFLAYTTREPIGVVGQIIPWNFPLLMAVWKLAPVLAVGCTSVLKPAEQTSLTALKLGELIVEAGYPEGVVNIVTGYGHGAGAALSAHPGVDKIAFTGSTEVGKLVGKAAMDGMKRVSLELGGKSPVIVLADADPDMVAPQIASAFLFNQGQICTAGTRLYIARPIFDAVVDRIAGHATALKMGPGLNPATELGPLVSHEQRRRVLDYIAIGVDQGANLVIGRDQPSDDGYFVSPALFVGATPDMRIVREEIFGPVAVATPFDDIDDAARLANDSIYGLAASIWSNDLKQVHRLAPRLMAGTVWVNCHNFLDPAMPFGGYKQSGIGRELGGAVIDLYTETKSTCIML